MASSQPRGHSQIHHSDRAIDYYSSNVRSDTTRPPGSGARRHDPSAPSCRRTSSKQLHDSSSSEHSEDLPISHDDHASPNRVSNCAPPSRDQSANPPSIHARNLSNDPSSPATKRSRSSDIPDSSRHNRATNFVPPKMQKRAPHPPPSHDRAEQFRSASIQNPQRRMMDHKTQIRPFIQSHNRPKKETAIHRDQGNETATSGATAGAVLDASHLSQYNTPTIQEQYQQDAMQYHKGVIQLPAHGKYPGLILQPDSSPISQEQLSAEVKGIYAGLVMVEAKCMNIDAAQAADPKQPLGPEQWQALIALHRTLLYEHHDFLMATQHPSATQALRGLATKYSMPARMWKHGIHAFLEVLRHRRPESQDYMLAFIYLAYQMMALLFETVPAFTDTWIECLGDLARYRMAIEQDKEIHAVWGGVAARWYTLASDRHPAIGRLYHHLGILERPSLRKFCLYAKSLTCVIPFGNARDSLATVCTPIVQDELNGQPGPHSAEARAVTLHAFLSSEGDLTVIRRVQADVLKLLGSSTPRDFGAYLAILNIAGLFGMGSPSNLLFQQYSTAINQAMQQSRPPVGMSPHPIQYSPCLPNTPPSGHLKASEDFWAASFNTLLESYDPASLHDFLPFVHVMLVNIHSLHSLRGRLLNGQSLDTYQSPVNTWRLAWGSLAQFLNVLAHQESITNRVLECARQGVFLAPERKEDAKPLSEDHLIRGLIWGQFYFSPGWFDGQSEDDGRTIETPSMQAARAQRVLWLGLYLAFHTDFIQYNVQERWFSSCADLTSAHPTTPLSANVEMTEGGDCYKEHLSTITNQGSRASPTASSSPSSVDGFTIVKHPKYEQDSTKPKQQPPSQSWAMVAAKPPAPSWPRKQKQEINTFQVADEDGMIWTADNDAYKASIRSGYSYR